MQREEWADIKGYEGWYQVSTMGRVRSVDRKIEQWSRYGHNIIRNVKGKVLSATDNGNGYLIVGLAKNQQGENRYVHRLVAETFIENQENLPEVNHIDFDKHNNAIDNLEWVSRIENIHHSISNMCVPKKMKLPGTGERFITKKKNKYRLMVQRKGMQYEKLFPTLQEAVEAREVLLGGGQHYAV